MSANKPRKSFSEAVRNGWERFLCPFAVVDQNGDHAHKKTILDKFDSAVFRPEYASLMASHTAVTLITAVNSNPIQPILETVINIPIILFLKYLYISKKSSPSYFVNTRAEGQTSNSRIIQDAMSREKRAQSATYTTLIFCLPFGMLMATLSKTSPIHNAVDSAIFWTSFWVAVEAEKLRARNILSGKWSTHDESPQYVTKAKETKNPAGKLTPSIG